MRSYFKWGYIIISVWDDEKVLQQIIVMVVDALILTSASRTMRNKCLLLKPPSLWNFVIEVQMDY